jgi:hypothetical protein
MAMFDPREETSVLDWFTQVCDREQILKSLKLERLNLEGKLVSKPVALSPWERGSGGSLDNTVLPTHTLCYRCVRRKATGYGSKGKWNES